MAMTEQRRMEIALLLVEQKILDTGLVGGGGDRLKRDLGNLGPRIGVSTDELLAFYETFLPKIIGKTFGYSQVSLVTKK
ncbi:MAG TPA: hypothetical protein PLZ99_03165 [Parcubacteria group bacterium]|jgi:hypothetical protein|nr:hypothetical protein [Parcubacteria group bacterium]